MSEIPRNNMIWPQLPKGRQKSTVINSSIKINQPVQSEQQFATNQS